VAAAATVGGTAMRGVRGMLVVVLLLLFPEEKELSAWILIIF
jgi:hypothetical protein